MLREDDFDDFLTALFFLPVVPLPLPPRLFRGADVAELLLLLRSDLERVGWGRLSPSLLRFDDEC